MLELGQPLHAFDDTKITGSIVVRRAEPGERLETLDHVVRELDPDDIVIADESGPISLAGTMGGLATEIDENSTDLLIEAAHFSPTGVARMARRHRLHSEASYRFERGVDPELPLRASAKAVALLASLGGGKIVPGCTHADVDVPPVVITMAADYPDHVAGMVYGLDQVRLRLAQVGCDTEHDRAAQTLMVIPPSWRSDLTDPADLAEEVIRLEGYENIPVRLAACLRRPRADPAPAAAPHRGPGPGRGRVRRGALDAVRVRRPTPTGSSFRPGTRAATCWPWPTRSATTSRCCRPRCCPGCSACSTGTSGAASPTSRCSRRAWCSCPGSAGGSSRRRCRWTGPRPSRSRPPWRPPCRTSRCTWPPCCPATGNRPAGGAPAGPNAGPTPWRRPGRSAGSARSRSRCAPTVRHPGTRAAAPPSSCGAVTARSRPAGSPGTRANCTRG